MKTVPRNSIIISCLIVIASSLCVDSTAQVDRHNDNYPKIVRLHAGQNVPGMKPEVFSPGFISTPDRYELNSIFSNDGKEFYFVISASTPEEKEEGIYFYIPMVTRWTEGTWTIPEKATFPNNDLAVDIAFSPDGTRLYYCSDKSIFPNAEGLDIWYVERKDKTWSQPVNMGSPINSPKGETQPSFTNEGKIYFPSARPGSEGVDIYTSQLVNGAYTPPEKLGSAINTAYNEGNSFVAPDESYILFARWGMPESTHGGKGLYISFRDERGVWSQAKYVERSTGMCGSLAALSPDGKYLFYSCGGDIYWVDSGIIEKLKTDLR